MGKSSSVLGVRFRDKIHINGGELQHLVFTFRHKDVNPLFFKMKVNVHCMLPKTINMKVVVYVKTNAWI